MGKSSSDKAPRVDAPRVDAPRVDDASIHICLAYPSPIAACLADGVTSGAYEFCPDFFKR